MRSVLEHVGLYVGLAVYTAAGAKVFSGPGGRGGGGVKPYPLKPKGEWGLGVILRIIGICIFTICFKRIYFF